MKLLYEASNALEAHMILNLLTQMGLPARVEGEHLQGGIGELQASGIVRLMIEESYYPEAAKVIQEWDAAQPAEAKDSHDERRSGFWPGLIGFFIGVGIMAVHYHSPVTHDGIDYNGDGVLDEKWTYLNGRISKAEVDRNFDGKVDFIYLYDRKGLVQSSLSDDDFNGTFETEIHYKNGNALWLKSDSTGDGFKDYNGKYKNGILDTITFIDPSTRKPIKIQKYSHLRLISAEVDTTRDGVMDTLYKYDSIEEISEELHINGHRDASIP